MITALDMTVHCYQTRALGFGGRQKCRCPDLNFASSKRQFWFQDRHDNSSQTKCRLECDWDSAVPAVQCQALSNWAVQDCWYEPFVGWLVACLKSQKQAYVSQERNCSDNCTCCHTEIEVADQTCYLTQSQYTDTGPTSPSADPKTPGAWQVGH